jgi:hypothetical protein
MNVDFFGTLPGLLSLAGAVLLFIVVWLIRRLAARPRQAAAAPKPAEAAQPAGPPSWLFAAVAAWAALNEEPVPSAEAWRPAASWHDPWLAEAGGGSSGRRKVGVYR